MHGYNSTVYFLRKSVDLGRETILIGADDVRRLANTAATPIVLMPDREVCSIIYKVIRIDTFIKGRFFWPIALTIRVMIFECESPLPGPATALHSWSHASGPE